MRTAPATIAFLAILAGCSTARHAPMRPAPITHLVLFTLADPADIDAFIADADAALPAIPGVESYSCGRPLDTGRAVVSGDYDIACSFGFATVAAYESYLAHPDHQRLVEAWRDRIASMRVYDFADATP
jgi:hypothetical protein